MQREVTWISAGESRPWESRVNKPADAGDTLIAPGELGEPGVCVPYYFPSLPKQAKDRWIHKPNPKFEINPRQCAVD